MISSRMMIVSLLVLITRIVFVRGIVTDEQYALMPELFHLDDYDLCLSQESRPSFCMINFQLYPLDTQEPNKIWKTIHEISSNPKNYRHDILRHGICTKTNGSLLEMEGELNKTYNEKYRLLGLKGEITQIRCENKDSTPAPNIYDALFLLFVILYGWLVVYATFSTADTNNFTTKNATIVSIFSLGESWKRLVSTDKGHNMEKLRGIQGVKVIIAVIVIHSHAACYFIGAALTNPQFLENDSPYLVLGERMIHPAAVMDVFFVLSAWFFAHNFFKDMERWKGPSFKYFFIAFITRAFRITPSLFFVTAFTSTWQVRISNGPLWYSFDETEYIRCRENGWSTLLYIQNFVKPEQMCFGPSWFLAVNMQFFVFSLFLLYLIHKYPGTISFILGGVLIFNIAGSFDILYRNQFPYPFHPSREQMFNTTARSSPVLINHHMSFVANLSGLVAGLTYGYIFYKQKNEKTYCKTIYRVCWGVVCTLYVLHFVIEIDPQTYPIANAVIGSLSRCCWSFFVAMTIFRWTQGRGSWFKRFCELSPMYVLGRLTFGAYLIHYTFVTIAAGSRKTAVTIGFIEFVTNDIVHVLMGFTGGLFLALFIEIPCTELVKHLTRSWSKTSQKQS